MKEQGMWLCAQLGAREHYSVPRALHRISRLETLFTDFWAGSGLRMLRPSSEKLRRLTGRFHEELAESAIESWNLRALGWEILRQYDLRAHRRSGVYLGYLEIGKRFAIVVRESLQRRTRLSPGTIFFAYDTGALEVIEYLRECGIASVVSQMDPNRVEATLVRREAERWAGWQHSPIEVPEKYFRRREQEWALADRILVNSEFCRQALIKQGVPNNKLVVVPLCYEPGPWRPSCDRPPRKNGHLRVLFLGQVILRKGIQYLIKAARLLRTEPVHFDVVGPISISRSAIASSPENVVFRGAVRRDQAIEWYCKSDLFVLPTLSDGFGIAQLEAMSTGLPVIATPCCGEVVTDGTDGFIVAPGSAEALAQTIHRYLSDKELLRAHGEAAYRKSRDFTLDRLANNLIRLANGLAGENSRPESDNQNGRACQSARA